MTDVIMMYVYLRCLLLDVWGLKGLHLFAVLCWPPYIDDVHLTV
jgi:hypothetical protein